MATMGGGMRTFLLWPMRPGFRQVEGHSRMGAERGIAMETSLEEGAPCLGDGAHGGIVFVLGLLLGILVFPSGPEAHLGEIVYPIYELPTSELPDLHDGSLEDWDAVLPNASLTHNDFRFWHGLAGAIDPADLAVRAFLAWHYESQRVYVAIERLDDVLLPSGTCCDAGTQFAVDGDHSGGQYWFHGDAYTETELRQRNFSQAQSYTAYPENLYDGRLLLTDQLLTWMTQPPWGDCGGWQIGESPNLSGVEFFVTPWDGLVYDDPGRSRRSVLEPGRIIGFQLIASDGDEPNRASGSYTLAVPTVEGFEGGGDFSHTMFAENFVDGELVPCHYADCSGASTSVRPSSWARIKAGLR